ncbi:MAG: transposase [Candidatus Desulfofervidus auxilii]|nr:transposase [Candidatus Desulfofervidus auxilii]
MKLTRVFKIPYRKDLIELFRASKELYNQALSLIKNHYKETKKTLNYLALYKIIRNNYPNLYKSLPSQTAQQILKLAVQDVKSFVKKLKKREKASFPSFKKSLNLLIFTNQTSKITNDGKIKLCKISQPINIPKGVYIDDFKNFQQIRLIPKKDYVQVDVVYNKECENKELNYDLYASIDLGVNNLVALVVNADINPILINGRPFKSYNQFYNKRRAYLQSIKDKMKIRGNTKRLNKLEKKRKNWFKDKFHQISKYLIRFLVKNKIGNLVIGYNKDWKNKVNLGKKNNQSFQYIPFRMLVNFLRYKAELVGIKTYLVKENYTSKVDALALEPFPSEEAPQKEFNGKRIKRGLFQSSIRVLVNADVNGALNILRKVIGDAFLRLPDRGLWCSPVKIRGIDPNSLQMELLNV